MFDFVSPFDALTGISLGAKQKALSAQQPAEGLLGVLLHSIRSASLWRILRADSRGDRLPSLSLRNKYSVLTSLTRQKNSRPSPSNHVHAPFRHSLASRPVPHALLLPSRLASQPVSSNVAQQTPLSARVAFPKVPSATTISETESSPLPQCSGFENKRGGVPKVKTSDPSVYPRIYSLRLRLIVFE